MPLSAEEDLAAYKKSGVEAIELCESKFPESHSARKELVSRLKDLPIEVTSVQAKVHSIFPDRMASDPAAPAKRLEAFKRSVGFWSEALEDKNLPFVLISGVAPDQDFHSGWKEARKWLERAKDAAARF